MTHIDHVELARAGLAAEIEIMTDADLEESAADIVNFNFGSLTEPRGDGWDQTYLEVTIYGITGTGNSRAHALRNWAGCVSRMHLEMEQERLALARQEVAA